MVASFLFPTPLTAEPNRGAPEDASHVEKVAAALRTRGRAYLSVLGSSMFPWLRPGDILWVCWTDFRQVSPGMVVLFAREGRLIVHRVIRKRATASGPALITKGDFVPRADAPVMPDELLGRVAWIQRGQRRIDLESRPKKVWGLLFARVSPSTRFWFSLARFFRMSRST